MVRKAMPALSNSQIRELAVTAHLVDISHKLVCPDCGKRDTLYITQSLWGRYYKCDTRSCPGTISAADDGIIKGIPANRATRKLRSLVFALMIDTGMTITMVQSILGKPDLLGVRFMSKEDCEIVLKPYERPTAWKRLVENTLGV